MSEQTYDCPDAVVCKTCPCSDDDDVCFPNERRRAEEALILRHKGWERWGAGAFLYDRMCGLGTGTVYTTSEALHKITGQ